MNFSFIKKIFKRVGENTFRFSCHHHDLVDRKICLRD